MARARARADWIWTPDGLARGGEVTVGDDGRIAQVRRQHTPGASVDGGADADHYRGILLPGLVNAHCHLELSDLAGLVPGGQGLSSWAQAMLARRRSPQPEIMRAALDQAHGAGTAAMIDVTNSGASIPLLSQGPVTGLAQIELLGIEADRCAAAHQQAAQLLGAPGLPCRATCHAVVSCSEALLQDLLSAPTSPAPAVTFHCDEDAADTLLIRDGAGPWADFLDRLGRQWRGRIGSAASPVQFLEGLGLLGPHLALVHCVHTGPRDLDRIAATGTAVVLCPRSNQHIGGRLPDVTGMVHRRIPLAIGTDSLASVADLDLLKEAAVLAAALPDVDPSVWMRALTTGGARLMQAAGDQRGPGDDLGGLVPGARNGLLWVDLPPSEDPLKTLFDGTAWPRRWLCPPVQT